MAIPESQLSRWAHHGAQQASIHTHEAIRRVLANYRWPADMSYDFYLQGSYRNHTNIRGDSDVDVVSELTSAFQYDSSALSTHEQSALAASFSTATYGWNDFRRDTLNALAGGFGQGLVTQGNKAIKLKAAPPRLAADVVVCMTHRRYANYYSYVKGIAFRALHDKRWVVNFPREHYANGAAKSNRTGDRYKRTVRMLKNARNYLESDHRIGQGLAPSYFVECFLHNAPDSAFQPSFQETYRSVVNWMVQADLDRLVCQNGRQYLFGPSPEQGSEADAEDFARHLAALWNDWE